MAERSIAVDLRVMYLKFHSLFHYCFFLILLFAGETLYSQPPFSLMVKKGGAPISGGTIVYENDKVDGFLLFDKSKWDGRSHYYCYVFHYTDNEPQVNLAYPNGRNTGENLLPDNFPGNTSSIKLFQGVIVPPFGMDHFVLVISEKPMQVAEAIRGSGGIRTEEVLKLVKGSKLSELYDPRLGKLYIKTLNIESRPAADKNGLSREAAEWKTSFVINDSAEIFQTPRPQKNIVRDSFPTIDLIDPAFDTTIRRGVGTLVGTSRKILFRGIAVDWRHGVRAVTINRQPVNTYRESSGYFDMLVEPREGLNTADITVENMNGFKRTSRVKYYFQPATATVTAPGRDHLFIIGINQYKAWPALNNARKDASDIRQLLADRFGFRAADTKELYDADASKKNIYNQLRDYVSNLGPNDRLLIYFAGHGFYDPALEIGYWIPSDASLDASDEYLNNLEITRMVQKMKAKNIFLIADACYSGQLLRDLQKENSGNYKSRMVLCSGKLKPVSDGRPGENSPFAREILAFFRTHDSKEILASALIQSIKESFRENKEQQPVGGAIDEVGDENGDFLFRRAER